MCEKCDERIKEDKKLKAATEPLGHIPEYTGQGIYDSYTCSCGWKSNRHWDLNEAAWDECRNHLKAVLANGQARLDLQNP